MDPTLAKYADAVSYAPMDLDNPQNYATSTLVWTTEEITLVYAITSPLYTELRKAHKATVRFYSDMRRPPVPSAPPMEDPPPSFVPLFFHENTWPNPSETIFYLRHYSIASDHITELIRRMQLHKFTQADLNELSATAVHEYARRGSAAQRLKLLSRFDSQAVSHMAFPEILFRGLLRQSGAACYFTTLFNVMFHATSAFDVLFTTPVRANEAPWETAFRAAILAILTHTRSSMNEAYLFDMRWMTQGWTYEPTEGQLRTMCTYDVLLGAVNAMARVDFKHTPVSTDRKSVV